MKGKASTETLERETGDLAQVVRKNGKGTRHTGGHEIGERIGAILYINEDDCVVSVLGYGTYQGEEKVPQELNPFPFSITTPKLQLDNGDVVWGNECWWGHEDEMKALIESKEKLGYHIHNARIGEARKNKPVTRL